MELKTVAIRVDRDIKPGEEILINYVGSGKSGDFARFSIALAVSVHESVLDRQDPSFTSPFLLFLSF